MAVKVSFKLCVLTVTATAPSTWTDKDADKWFNDGTQNAVLKAITDALQPFAKDGVRFQVED